LPEPELRSAPVTAVVVMAVPNATVEGLAAASSTVSERRTLRANLHAKELSAAEDMNPRSIW
jgi:hypothetical protein